MTTTTQNDSVLDNLVLLTRSIRAMFDARARRLGMTYSRARTLATITRMPGATQVELAQSLRIEGPTLKRQLDGLERAGLARRAPCEEDARKHAVFPTESALSEEISMFRGETEAALIDGIPPAELATTLSVLQRMVQNAERLERG